MGGCKIAIITGSRAEWGLLKPLAQKIEADPDMDLQLIVTGSHLSPQFGMTVNEIPSDWIADKIECILASDTPVAISKAIGLAVISFGETYERIKPDLVVVLGDRFEILASVIAAHISGIPIVHIHGGEITEGVYDDAFRHSITKMSQLHFVAAEPYRKRVIQLGEHPDTVFNVGALGCDELKKIQNWPITKRALVLLHPETLTIWDDKFTTIYFALTALNIDIDYIEPNPDKNSQNIIWKQDKMAMTVKHPSQFVTYDTVDRNAFLAIMGGALVVISNSSAGIIEAPALGIPTINIGDRQKGRLMADSIIQAEPTQESIKAAFDKLYSKEFQALMKTDYYMPYKGENVAEKIIDTIKRMYPKIDIKKGFYDLP